MLGTCCIRAYSKGQSVIALSSGEAEYYGLVSGASNALGDVAAARDWGVRLKARCVMDATAGIAIGSRRGLGRVRHIDTMFLWVQDLVAKGDIEFRSVATALNISELGTKSLAVCAFKGLLAMLPWTVTT